MNNVLKKEKRNDSAWMQTKWFVNKCELHGHASPVLDQRLREQVVDNKVGKRMSLNIELVEEW